MGIPYPGGVYEGSEFWAETLGTFFITYVFMAMTIDNNQKIDKKHLPLVLGLVVYVVKATLGELSGGSFNPARTLGPGIISGSIGTLEYF